MLGTNLQNMRAAVEIPGRQIGRESDLGVRMARRDQIIAFDVARDRRLEHAVDEDIEGDRNIGGIPGHKPSPARHPPGPRSRFPRMTGLRGRAARACFRQNPTPDAVRTDPATQSGSRRGRGTPSDGRGRPAVRRDGDVEPTVWRGRRLDVITEKVALVTSKPDCRRSAPASRRASGAGGS